MSLRLTVPGEKPEPYITRAQLAELMGVHPDTIKRWTRKGMPHTRFMERTVRYQASVAIAWAREFGER